MGKGVHDVLPSKYIRASNWVYQPNVRFTNPAKDEEKALGELRILEAIKRKCEIQNANDFSGLKKLENKIFPRFHSISQVKARRRSASHVPDDDELTAFRHPHHY